MRLNVGCGKRHLHYARRHYWNVVKKIDFILKVVK
jgi:hypothetical protein